MKAIKILVTIISILSFSIILFGEPYNLVNEFKLDTQSLINNKMYFKILIVLFIVYIVLITISTLIRIIQERKEEENRQIVLLGKIKKYDPTLDEFKIVDDVFEIYKKVVEAFYNYDIDTINKYVTNYVCDEYKKELNVFQNSQIQSKKEDIVLDYGKLLDVSKKNNIIKIKVYISISHFNAIYEHDKKLGMSDFKKYSSYMFTFLKIIDECPFCGNDTSNCEDICPNCNNKIVKTNHNWIMAKKEEINK